MQAAIGGVDLYVITNAWSLKGVAYMVSRSGKADGHMDQFNSCFEDEYSNAQE